MPIVASYYRARYYDPSAGRFVLEETAYSGKVIGGRSAICTPWQIGNAGERRRCTRENCGLLWEGSHLWQLARCPVQGKWYGGAGRFTENRIGHVGTLPSL